MKLLDESGKGVAAGSKLDLAESGLPVAGHHGTLVVFWKRQ